MGTKINKTLGKLVDNKGNKVFPSNESIETKRKAAFDAIVKKAILINMTKKQMANIPFDVKLADEVCKKHNIKNKSYIQVRKCILNPQYLINIRSIVSDALLMVWNSTRPWDNTGFRLLPMDCHDDFTKTFSKIKDDFEEAVQVFCDNFPTYLAEAKKDLGSAFNKNDYPDPADVKQHFALDIVTSKFPDIDDIRLNLTNDELVKFQDEVVDRYSDALNTSIEKLFELIDDKNKTKKECSELFQLIKTLNVSDDASINLKLKTAKEQLKSRFGKDFKAEDSAVDVNEDSMMMVDDLEDFDENELKDYEV